MNREKVIKGLERCLICDISVVASEEAQNAYRECEYTVGLYCEQKKLLRDALALLKEQEAVQWINVNDKLPENDGQYLVVYTFFDYRAMGVVRFSHNLHEIDEYIFESKPGWYEPDDEVGYFERTTVTHWAKLPEFPKEG